MDWSNVLFLLIVIVVVVAARGTLSSVDGASSSTDAGRRS
jgi:hypothetical protein